MNQNQKKWTGSIELIFAVVFFMFLGGVGFAQSYDWELLPWNLNLEELNRAFKEKHNDGQIQEDKHRTEFEFQYSPEKSVKVSRGDLTALISVTEPSAQPQLYGYA